MLPIPLFETYIPTHIPPESLSCTKFCCFGITYECRRVEVSEIASTDFGDLIEDSCDLGYVPILSPIVVLLDPSIVLFIILIPSWSLYVIQLGIWLVTNIRDTDENEHNSQIKFYRKETISCVFTNIEHQSSSRTV